VDDTGFGDLGCYGGLGGRVATPNVDALAGSGVIYNNFHVNSMCSPTRAALLTGRNHHSVGVGSIMELASGYPGYDARIPKEAAMLGAVLRSRGYSTMALGKWHLTPVEDITPVGPFGLWPLGQGFDRFYGFMGAETDQYRPELYQDNHALAGPPVLAGKPDGLYHLSEDLVDHAIAGIGEQRAVAPSRPFFCYLAFGAMHQPHQVWPEWSDRYRGVFSDGWDRVRQQNLDRQKGLGIVPPATALPPPNLGVPAWADLSSAEHRLCERQVEVYAGFLSHTDHQIGRLVRELSRQGALDDTLLMVLSDNGATGEGGPLGTRSPVPAENGMPDTLDTKLTALDVWGGPSTSPCYAAGWAMAGNAPNRWYKQFTYEGGTRAPLIVHWPNGTLEPGRVRPQFHHVVDVMPTVLEAAGISMPAELGGYAQRPLDGVSFAYTFRSAAEPTRKHLQYFEMVGHRAIWAEGWKAVALHWSRRMLEFVPDPTGLDPTGPFHDGDFDADRWELYHLDLDFSESRDLAADQPEKLSKMVELWWSEAGRNQVLPLSEQLIRHDRPEAIFERRPEYIYFGPIRLTESASPDLHRRSHTITAVLDVPPAGGEGVVLSQGGPEGGYALVATGGRAHYVTNLLGREVGVASSEQGLPSGPVTLRVEVDVPAPGQVVVTIEVNGDRGQPVGLVGANPVTYDVRGRGLRVGSGLAGVWPSYVPAPDFNGRIVEVRIALTGDENPSGAEARARAAMTEQ
jgi:arylsulfatase A-like enzyme